MKRIIFLFVLLSLLGFAPIGMAEEWSYSVALEVGDSFEFEHTRSLDVVKNGSILANVSESFIANVTIDAIELVNVTDEDFGNYTDMIISSSVVVGNDTVNATESVFDLVFLNSVFYFGMDVIMSEIANDSVAFTEVGDYGYFNENNSTLGELFVADVEEMNFSSFLELSAFGEFELGLNDTYEGVFELAMVNDTFSLFANESYFFASEGNVSVDLFVDVEYDFNSSVVTKSIKQFSLAVGNDSLAFEDSFVEYVAPVVVETTAESSAETTEEESANFILFALPLALIPLIKRKN
tara:strand:+ start:96 stop:980 length:885 start_codon:yes stop_codon:yes gene_type:complete